MHATRVSIRNNKLVYVLIADKRIKYGKLKSRIVYIGTTEKGVKRISQSVGARAVKILELTGVHSFHARVITCTPRQNTHTWRKLERGLLICFKEKFAATPKCNLHGKGFKVKDEFKIFSRSALMNIIEELS
ncbi:MAG TPA: hypothetical protein VNU94_03780 [Acidobacteriaceae bacterium]|nr:hypothetical protein [Acidobacteriaceae bacterium]